MQIRERAEMGHPLTSTAFLKASGPATFQEAGPFDGQLLSTGRRFMSFHCIPHLGEL